MNFENDVTFERSERDRNGGGMNEKDRLLDVGLAAHEGLGVDADVEAAADALVRRALEDRRHEDLPIRLAVLMATGDWSRPSQNLPAYVRAALRNVLHRDVPLIGGSMAKIVVSCHPDGLLDQGIGLALFCSYDLWASVACLEKPYVHGLERRVSELKRVANHLEENMTPRLGATAHRYVVAVFPGFTKEIDGLHMRDTDFQWEVKAAFADNYQIFGASAADSLTPVTGYQFVNDQCHESSLAIALVENDLRFATSMAHAFTPQRDPRVSVDRLIDDEEVSEELETLDGKPADERLRELRQMTEIEKINDQPLFGLRSAGEFRLILPVDITAGRVRVSRNVALGDRLVCMRPKTDILNLCKETFHSTFSATETQPNAAMFFLAFTCRGLYNHFRPDKKLFAEALVEFRRRYPRAKAMVGFCTAEFAPTEKRGPDANHMSIAVRCYTDELSHRASSQRHIRQLSRAVISVLSQTKPSEVMQTALEGAVAAGALGGQFCLWDRRLKRIVGKGLGRAYRPPDSPHDWQAVSDMTNRPAPAMNGGEYPADLEDWLMRVTGDMNLIPSADNSDNNEDLLTMIARTGFAVFVPDSSDSKFHCRQDAIEAGKIMVQIAIPVIGANGVVLGTFQASFEDGRRMNRDEFMAWIQYVQRTGVVLEAALEKESREERAKLAHEVARLHNKQFEPDNRKHFQEFCEIVYQVLGADAVHMRLLRMDRHDCFELVGYAGPKALQELYPLVRKTTYAGKDGASSRATLERGGSISRSLNEARALRWNITAVDHRDLAQSLRDGLNRFHATATLPVLYEGLLLGTIVIDSKFEFFFSESRELLARESAKIAGQVIRRHEGERLRQSARASSSASWEGGAPGQTTSSNPEAASEQRLKSLLQETCRFVNADCASLFVWNKDSEDLVLLAQHNWHEPREGRARYKMGEGWVGRIAVSQDRFSLFCERQSGDWKYDEFVEPPEHRSMPGDRAPRIGIKLTEGRDLVGVVILSYYRVNAERYRLINENARHLLLDVAQVISGWVTSIAINREKRRRASLERIKDDLAAGLLAASPKWQALLNDVRDAFEIERLELLLVDGNSVRAGWIAPRRETGLRSPAVKLDDSPLLVRIVRGREEVTVKNIEDGRIEGWADSGNIKTLFAIPVAEPPTNVWGILAMINRHDTAAHPFPFLDSLEREGAIEIARLLGAAIARHEHREQLASLNTEVQTANRIAKVSLFGAVITHELMGPSTRIQRAVDCIRVLDKDFAKPFLREIETEVQQSRKTIERLTQHPGGRADEPVKRIVREALRAIESRVPRPGVTTKVSNDLQVNVSVSLYSIVTAVVNILNNALEEMGDNGILTISTMLLGDNGVEISVHNSGPTLAKHEIDQILRSNRSRKNPAEHAGLGVRLAKLAVEEAGGNLEMVSPPSGGVRVAISLPLSSSAGLKMATK